MTRQAETQSTFDEKEWAKTLKRLRRANRDIGLRAASYIEIDYFPDRDYLYVTLSEEKANLGVADYLNSDPSFEVAYYDPQTFVIGGFDVPFFLEKSAQRSFEDVWSIIAAKIQGGSLASIDNYQRYAPTGLEAERLAGALQALIDHAA